MDQILPRSFDVINDLQRRGGGNFVPHRGALSKCSFNDRSPYCKPLLFGPPTLDYPRLRVCFRANWSRIQSEDIYQQQVFFVKNYLRFYLITPNGSSPD